MGDENIARSRKEMFGDVCCRCLLYRTGKQHPWNVNNMGAYAKSTMMTQVTCQCRWEKEIHKALSLDELQAVNDCWEGKSILPRDSPLNWLFNTKWSVLKKCLYMSNAKWIHPVELICMYKCHNIIKVKRKQWGQYMQLEWGFGDRRADEGAQGMIMGH